MIFIVNKLTAFSCSGGMSNTHLNFESMRSSGFASFHCTSKSTMFDGAKMVCTINLCLLFSLGSYSNGCNITKRQKKNKIKQSDYSNRNCVR
uniref:Uncharacterized protein n=1 Tax=Leptobrachium leishanense TaxID=445787 RepID=A0A8C5QH73_9ANUR